MTKADKKQLTIVVIGGVLATIIAALIRKGLKI